MKLPYASDAAGTGDKFRLGILEFYNFRIAMCSVETPKKILTSEACFLYKAIVLSEEKIEVFGKS